MIKSCIYFLLLLNFLLYSCNKETVIQNLPEGAFEINGKIAYQSLEGGFYGIISKGGERYLPINLPEDYKKNNLNVRLFATVHYGHSILQWGTMIKIHSINKTENGN